MLLESIHKRCQGFQLFKRYLIDYEGLDCFVGIQHGGEEVVNIVLSLYISLELKLIKV